MRDYLDRRLKIANMAEFEAMPETKFGEHDVRTHLLRKVGVPGDFPLCSEK